MELYICLCNDRSVKKGDNVEIHPSVKNTHLHVLSINRIYRFLVSDDDITSYYEPLSVYRSRIIDSLL